jgi:hypothetical protein
MDSFSILDPLAWQPEYLQLHPAYAAGNAAAWLSKAGSAGGTNHYLSGRLYVSKSGWLLLSVPNALVRGVFDAMTAPGAELPLAGTMNVPDVKPDLLNAHISVMTAEEVSAIGADKINERGHHFRYALGPVKEITPKSIAGISRVWAIQVASPELAALRKSYGLTPLLHGDHQFHITVAVRRAKVLGNNAVSKFDTAPSRGELKAAEVKDVPHGGQADHAPDKKFNAETLAEGVKHEHEHTDDGQVAKEIAKDHLQEDPAYYKKVEQIEKQSANPYMQQLKRMYMSHEPIPYDSNKPVFENIRNQLAEVKRRGDFMLRAERNQMLYRSQLDPHYRNQLALMAYQGRYPQPDRLTRSIERHGDEILNMFSKARK